MLSFNSEWIAREWSPLTLSLSKGNFFRKPILETVSKCRWGMSNLLPISQREIQVYQRGNGKLVVLEGRDYLGAEQLDGAHHVFVGHVALVAVDEDVTRV